MRPHHWLKNGLVFVPILLNHDVFDLAALGHGVVAFVAFSLLGIGDLPRSTISSMSRPIGATRRSASGPCSRRDHSQAQAYAAVLLLLIVAFD